MASRSTSLSLSVCAICARQVSSALPVMPTGWNPSDASITPVRCHPMPTTRWGAAGTSTSLPAKSVTILVEAASSVSDESSATAASEVPSDVGTGSVSSAEALADSLEASVAGAVSLEPASSASSLPHAAAINMAAAVATAAPLFPSRIIGSPSWISRSSRCARSG